MSGINFPIINNFKSKEILSSSLQINDDIIVGPDNNNINIPTGVTWYFCFII